jgi:hypothetical protein
MSEKITQKLKGHDKEFKESKNTPSRLENQPGTVDSDVGTIKEEETQNWSIQADKYTAKLNQLLEAVLHTYRMLVPREEIERRFENHESRITAIEHSIRKNPENSR